jgi:hypothetical protein
VKLAYKEDWPQVRARFDAWWRGAIIDRPLIQITAPREPQPTLEEPPQEPDRLYEWFTDPGQVIPRLERQVAATYWAGDAFPMALPVSGSLVAILAAYLGCPYRIVPGSNTAWTDPLIDDWDNRPVFGFDADNKWWRISLRLLELGARHGVGRYQIGIPDLQGDGEILALLRGSDRLAMDLIERPQEVKRALEEVNVAWLHYWQACNDMIHRWMDGYVDWLGVWSESPAVTLECDFSIMISTQMFEEFFLPVIEQQTKWVERTIYHLDGPGAVRHLDALLALPDLRGIQWVPGAGAAPMSEWIPLLQRIQAAGKLLVLECEKWEVEKLLAALRPEGLLLQTRCDSVEEADQLLAYVSRLAKAA